MTVTALVPGDDFTCTVSCTNRADNTAVNAAISTTTATAASGTVNYGKVFAVANFISVRSRQFRLEMLARAYDGGSTPVLLGGETALSRRSPSASFIISDQIYIPVREAPYVNWRSSSLLDTPDTSPFVNWEAEALSEVGIVSAPYVNLSVVGLSDPIP